MSHFSQTDSQLKPVIQQLSLVLALAICLALAIFVIMWANQPERDWRPLIANINMVDAVKIVDALEAAELEYYTKLESKLIYVNAEDLDRARLTLARIGFVVEYPDIRLVNDENEACTMLASSIAAREAERKAYATDPNSPIYNQPWFLKMVRLVSGALVIIVLIVAVVRPMLRVLIYGTEEIKDE